MVPGPGACTLPFLCHQSLLSRWEGSSDHTVACSPCLLPSHLPNPPLRWLPQLLKPSHTMFGILCCFYLKCSTPGTSDRFSRQLPLSWHTSLGQVLPVAMASFPAYDSHAAFLPHCFSPSPPAASSNHIFLSILPLPVSACQFLAEQMNKWLSGACPLSCLSLP